MSDYEDVYSFDDDEVSDDEIYAQIDAEGENHIGLETPEDFDDNEEEIVIKRKAQSLVSVLRDELRVQEPDRGSLTFKYLGKEYEGVPMAEINSNKFVFKILPDGKMKSFVLSDIKLVDLD